jgi:outer membrane receptor protein involved in Fe transport
VIPESSLLGFRYAPNLPIPGELSFGASWRYHSKFFNNTANEGPLVQTYAANLFKASINWYDDDGRWKVALEGNNLTDEHYILHAIQIARPLESGGPAVTGYPNSPRQVTLRVGYSY